MTLGLEVRGIPPDLDDMYVNEDPEFWEEKFSQTAVLYNGPASDNAIASRYLGRFGTESPDEDKHLGYTDDELELDEFWENAVSQANKPNFTFIVDWQLVTDAAY